MTEPRRDVEDMADVLRALGLPADDVDRAGPYGTVAVGAIDRLVLGGEIRHDVVAASERSGLTTDQVRHLWRSLGFPDPGHDEAAFTDRDVDNMAAVAELIRSGAVSEDVTLQMTRVIGSSMARVASAMVDAVTARVESSAPDGGGVDPIAAGTGAFLPQFPLVLEQVWRRHLQVAARRRMLRGETEDAAGVVVGFADLVGFTALAQQVSDEALAAVVDEFERLAYDVVVARGGRVVKMIGDEVMFLVEDPAVAAEVALDLADASRDAAGLSDVRVGLALGPVLEREGDAYGNTVNLASRITSIAYPGTVVVSAEVRDALRGHDQLSFRAMRPRTLKGFGRVHLSVVRRAGDARSSIREAFEDRRRRIRERLAQ